MTPTTPDITTNRAPAPRRTHDRPHAEPRDPTAPTRPITAALPDDRSHTPPQGDAILARSAATSNPEP